MNVKLLRWGSRTGLALALIGAAVEVWTAAGQPASCAEESSWLVESAVIPAMPPDETLSIPLPVRSAKLDTTYARARLHFERNDGQVDSEVKFLARGPGYHLFLTQTEAVMVLSAARASEGAERLGLRQSSAALRPSRTATKAPEDWRSPKPGGDATVPKESPASAHVLRMRLVGANPSASVRGEGALRSKVNYFIGNDASLWHTNISTFAKVRCAEVYPGIDLVYYGNEGRLEYDFLLAPGANPDLIALQFEGTDRIELDPRGDLIAWVAGRPVRWQKPAVYQEHDGQRIEIAGAYRLNGSMLTCKPDASQKIGFELAAYDRSLPLVIDPVLVYSTYLGGGSSDDISDSSAKTIAVDAQGNTYITGSTISTDFPTKAALNSAMSGQGDAFVAKFSSKGELLYSTYLGGSGDDGYGYSGTGLAVDPTGTCYLAGWTSSTNFPLVNPIQAALGGKTDGFVAALKPDGSALMFSSYLGGRYTDWIEGVALDSSGNIYLVGSTDTDDFPVRNAIQSQFGGKVDGFVAKLEPGGRSIIYSTYIGGSDTDFLYAIAADDEGNAYIAGHTFSQDFPVRNAYQPFSGGGTDIFYAKVLPDGSDFVYSSYFGGAERDAEPALALGPDGSLVIAGSSLSPGLATAGAYQTSDPVWPGILARFKATDGSLLAASYVDPAYLRCIAIDADGNVITGGVAFENRPMVDPLQPTIAGDGDGFIAKFSPDLSSLLFSTYLGGAGREEIKSLALAPNGDLVVSGGTESTNFPTRNAFQPNFGGGDYDVFVAKISMAEVLKVSRSGQILAISWPASATGYQLESTTTLGTGTTWENVATPPVVIGDEQVVTVDIEGQMKFYRLKKR